MLQYLNAKKSPSLRVLNGYWAELLVQADLENFATITKIATLPMNLLIVMSKDGDTIIHSDSIGEGKDGDTIIHSDTMGEGKCEQNSYSYPIGKGSRKDLDIHNNT